MPRLAPTVLALACLVYSAQAMADETSTTLKKITETGVISLGYREAEPPFSYKIPDGKIIGFSMDLCHQVVEAVRQHLKLDNLTVDYVAATSATRFVLVKSGKIDIECAATTNNAERRKVVGFSYPHFTTATQYMTRRADGIAKIEDLAGRSVAAASGTVNIEQLNTLNREKQLNIGVLPTKTNSEAFDLVASARASAFVWDGILLAAMIAQAPDPSTFELSEETLSPPEPYGLLVRHGDEEFRMVVNAALERIFTSPEIDTIYKTWFMSPIPPDGMNLRLPMSPTLKAAFTAPTAYLD
ncbi:amino acid ABC transporter substrate-binding protein [Pararhizobium antarcticum]|uniref:ABC transporter substrate-binding protein n=1 Tax=Pararhizobium antarcticum TaxID=1798805 RepID=A0A657LXG7_9HYPH|nr:amino acid ABC transporter substrate-binding protein [Pararhizobium antarcticum]OJF97641.1 ABC transporter substrate-binding protein [Pararhizobium antarcticum]OJF99895.1 ABC transporter substrate-binding protein [Rhizobium sp. 58]